MIRPAVRDARELKGILTKLKAIPYQRGHPALRDTQKNHLGRLPADLETDARSADRSSHHGPRLIDSSRCFDWMIEQIRPCAVFTFIMAPQQ